MGSQLGTLVMAEGWEARGWKAEASAVVVGKGTGLRVVVMVAVATAVVPVQ